MRAAKGVLCVLHTALSTVSLSANLSITRRGVPRSFGFGLAANSPHARVLTSGRSI